MHDFETRIDMPQPRGWTAIVDLERKDVRLVDCNEQFAGRSPISEAVDSGAVRSLRSSDGFVPLPECIISEIVQIEELSESP